MHRVQREASASIRFKEFLTTSSNGIISEIHVKGTAHTRETLAQFRDILEASLMFEKVEIPITDLVRDVDLPFAIKVILTKN